MIRRKLDNFFTFAKLFGFKHALLFSVNYVLDYNVRNKKKKVLNHLVNMYGNNVAHGPFKGFSLGDESWWGGLDSTSKILGVYEDHIATKIFSFSKIKSTFVDIGAADGYYANGVAYADWFDSIVAFEENVKGQKIIESNAISNGVANKIQIFGRADYESIRNVINKVSSGVFLIDIEGGEYSLLDSEVLELLQDSYVIIELHPWLIKDGYAMQDDLVRNAEKFFDVSVVHRENYNPNEFTELNGFTDDERLLSLSEGRTKNMEWLILQPRG